MTYVEDLAIDIYTRMVSVRIALEDAKRLAMNATAGAYLVDIQDALDHVQCCMLECCRANPVLGGVSGFVNKVVTDYAATTRLKQSDGRE